MLLLARRSWCGRPATTSIVCCLPLSLPQFAPFFSSDFFAPRGHFEPSAVCKMSHLLVGTPSSAPPARMQRSLSAAYLRRCGKTVVLEPRLRVAEIVEALGSPPQRGDSECTDARMRPTPLRVLFVWRDTPRRTAPAQYFHDGCCSLKLHPSAWEFKGRPFLGGGVASFEDCVF